ncbi:MAG TPA: hypothetical protein VHW96_07605 [Solirubrobacteraceae bacterium]|nr:hypothetical protein [Solirubrobacteraceae bacterium]
MAHSDPRESPLPSTARLRGSLDGPSKTITVEPIQVPVPPQRVDPPDPARPPERPRGPERPREPAR